MAMIHVNRSGANLGTYAEEEVRAGLRAGRFVSSDLGWREGMAQWQPLSQFSQFAADIPTGAAAAPPPAPAGAAVPAMIAPAVAVAAARSGLPWENREARGLFNAFADTLAMILSKPSTAFSVMRTEGGFSGPLLFAVIGGGIGAIVAFILML